MNDDFSMIDNDLFFYEHGHDVFGPLLLGFCRWLNKESEKHELDQLVFVARDGYVIKSAYEMLYPDSADTNFYMYVSRKSTLPIRIKNSATAESLLSTLHIRKRTSPNQLLDRTNLPQNSLAKIRKAYDALNFEKPIAKKVYLKNGIYASFVNDLKTAVVNDSSIDNLIEYIDENIALGCIGIVDVGWNGSTQKALSDIERLEGRGLREYKGYYFNANICDSCCEEKSPIEGYIYQKGDPTLIDAKSSMGLLEFFVTAPHPTTIGYERIQDGTISPILGEYEFFDHESQSFLLEDCALRSLHSGALRYVEDHKKDEIGFDESTKPLFNLAEHPSEEELGRFGSLRFYEGGFHPLAKSQGQDSSSAKSLFSLREFARSTWKLGYLFNYIPSRNIAKKIYKTMVLLADR